MSVADKLSQLATIKSNIKSAIIAKGVTVGDDMTAYATAIGNIQTGGGSSGPEIVGYISKMDLQLILDSFPFDTDDDGSVNVLDYNEIVSAIFTNPEDVASAVLANSPVGGATQHMTARTIPPTSNRRYFFKDLYSEYFDGIALPVDIDNNGLYWVAFDFGNFTQGDGLLYNYYIVWKGCIPAHAPVATSSIP